MSKKLSYLSAAGILSLAVLVLAAYSPVANAQEGWVETERISGPNCFDYYKFQSVDVSLGATKSSYKPGEKITFSGYIANENNYPVVDGYVFARVSKINPKLGEGNFIIDEFVALENIAIDANENKNASFSWTVPENPAGGNYRVDFFFSVGKKFNLGGLPFTNEVIAGSTNFNVSSLNTSSFYFDGLGTKINGRQYFQIGGWPVIDSGSKAVVTQVLKNGFKQPKNIKVQYDLYYWDSLNEADKISSKTENVEIGAGKSATLSFEVSEMKETVYYLKITASEGSEKAIVNVRFTTVGEKARLNYPGITKFPLMKGDNFSLFSCFHNSSYGTASGKVLVSLYDRNNMEVGRSEYSGKIASAMAAAKTDIMAEKNYDYLRIKAEISNGEGKIVDSYSAIYDCKLISNNDVCKNIAAINARTAKMRIYALGGGLLLVIVALAISKMFKKKKDSKVPPVPPPGPLFPLIIILLGFAFLAPQAMAYNSRSAVVERGYTLQTYFGTRLMDWIASGNVSVTHNIEMTTGNTVLPVGNSASFAYNGSLFFTGTGGAWDTPYGIDCSTQSCPVWNIYNLYRGYFTSELGTPGYYVQEYMDGAGIGKGYMTWTWTHPSVTFSSSDASVISCSGNTCSALKPGNARITANIGNTPTRIWSFLYRWASNGEGVDCPAAGWNTGNRASWVPINDQPEGCFSGILYDFTSSPSTVKFADEVAAGYNRNLPTASVSWDITVPASPSVTPACNGTASVANASWNAISGYTQYQVRIDTNTNKDDGFWYKENSSATSIQNIPQGFVSYNFSGVPNGTPFSGNLNPGTTYNFQVIYHNGTFVDVVRSNFVSFVARDCVSPPPPGGICPSCNAGYCCVSNACVSCVPNDGGCTSNSQCSSGCCQTNVCKASSFCGGGPVCGFNGCEAGETCSNCPTDCGECVTGDYNLQKSADISVTLIDPNYSYNSSLCNISVVPSGGFNSNVGLSVKSQPVGGTPSFGDSTLSSSEYGTGSSFRLMSIPGTTQPGDYTIRVKGLVGTAMERVVDVILHVIWPDTREI